MKLPNILNIYVEEPTSDPLQPSLHHSLADDPTEAEKRYRALIHVLVSQLTGLSQTHVRFIVSPSEPAAVEAVSFWMLPLFRGEVIKHGNHFHFTPEQNALAFTIEFTSNHATHQKFEKIATLSAHCPQCSSRWINAAMLQCSEFNQVIGEDYLTISQLEQHANCGTTHLPKLPVIHTDTDWRLAIGSDSPIGAKLQKYYQQL